MGRDYNQLKLQLSVAYVDSQRVNDDLNQMSQQGRTKIREKKVEAEVLFDRSVELRRRVVQMENHCKQLGNAEERTKKVSLLVGLFCFSGEFRCAHFVSALVASCLFVVAAKPR